jgi:RNA polymerase sigma-70 factor, ECF subfamily
MARIEPTQLGRWFDAHAAGLVLYAQQWVGRPVAEDLVQDVFVRLAAQAREPENVRAWLLVAVRHAALDAVKMAGRRQARERQAGAARAGLFAAGPEAALDGGELQEALMRLPPEEREVITLRIWAGGGGATFEEIAEIMGLPLSTVYSHYRSGLARLRARWELPCQKR